MEAKERILIKANELFNRYGIRSVSMDDIAAQLGMSKKTLYQYYTDKDELVDAVFTTIMETNKLQCTECSKKGKNAIDEVFLSFDMMKEMLGSMHPSVIFDLQKYHSNTFNKFQEYRNNFLYKIIKHNLEHGIQEGLYRDDFDVDILTRFRIHSIMLPFDSNIFPNNKSQLLKIEQEILEHFLYGLATNKGEKLILKYKSQRSKN
jgi:AcrR family transcriptional regulator